MRLDSTVHYGRGYDNAFWNGSQMVFGDGDGRIFRSFTSALDVIGHELCHGVIQHEAELQYRDQAGALNEWFSDVFGSLVKQYSRRQSAEEADWLIGSELFMPGIRARGIRSLKEAGASVNDSRWASPPALLRPTRFFATASRSKH